MKISCPAPAECGIVINSLVDIFPFTALGCVGLTHMNYPLMPGFRKLDLRPMKICGRLLAAGIRHGGRVEETTAASGCLVAGSNRHGHESTSRRLCSISVAEILTSTASQHDVGSSQFTDFRSPAVGRDMAAWLALLSSVHRSGLAGSDSVSNLVRRADKRRQHSCS